MAETMGAFQIQDLPESLVIIQPRGNGCSFAAGLLFLSLIGWVLGCMLADDWSSGLLNAIVIVGLVEIVLLGVTLYSLMGRERLIVRAGKVTYENSAIVTFDRCIIRMEDIKSVDMLPLDPSKRNDHAVGVIVITGSDSEIRFGVGLSSLELQELLSRVRQKIFGQRTQQATTQGDSLAVEAAHRNHEKRTWKMPYEAFLFALAVVIALIFRFSSLPSDFGGCIFQMGVSIGGLAVLAVLAPRLKPFPRTLTVLVVVPDAIFLVWGSLHFAPQVLFPFVFLAGVTTGACYLWSRSKPRLAALVALALIPILADSYFYGVAHMRQVDRIRCLLPQEIQEVRIEGSSQGRKLVIRDGQTLALLAKGLGDTSPYSPNHESISLPRQMIIHLVDGSEINFRIGKGNQAHVETVWIEFGVEVYQNPSLYPVLQSLHAFSQPQPAGQ